MKTMKYLFRYLKLLLLAFLIPYFSYCVMVYSKGDQYGYYFLLILFLCIYTLIRAVYSDYKNKVWSKNLPIGTGLKKTPFEEDIYRKGL